MQVLALGGQRENFLWIVPYLLFVAIFFFFCYSAVWLYFATGNIGSEILWIQTVK